MITIDVVCPLYRAEEELDALLGALAAQKGVQIHRAVFPITQVGDTASVESKLREAGFDYFFVEQSEFSHSRTRERAILEYCESDVVLMLSQDVRFVNDGAVLALTSAINAQTVYAYGRQICKKKTIEHYTREKNYGEQSHTVTLADVERLQLSAFFASDAFSAYHRPTFVALGGYDGIHMMMNEDMYYAKKVIDAGLSKAYVAEAVAEHSHRYSFKQLYQRYRATGEWFAAHPAFDGYQTTSSGMALAKYVCKRALRDCNLPVLVRFLPDMAARYLGMRKGKRS